jgi:DNA-binding NarL/FixJ family response regulator
MAIRIVIADDHEVVRTGLKVLLQDTDVRIVGAAATGRAALRLVKKHRPDLALLDVRMPDGNGLDCLARITRDHPETAVLIFSGYDNRTYLARALALGAAGFIPKSARRQQIIRAIRLAAVGKRIWSRKELRDLTGALTAPRGRTIDVPLTNRQNEVLKQIALGLSNKDIAKSLGISYETAKVHVKQVLRKLGLSDRTQAAVWAVRKKLV